MERRSDRYNSSQNSNELVSSRVNKNKLLYEEVNSKIGYEEITTIDTNDGINLSSLDMDNLKRSDYQKVKDYKDFIDPDEKKEEEKPQEVEKKKNYDINKVLAEAKKNRQVDELEQKRSIKNEEYDVLNNLNRKYLHQKGFSEDDNEELKELIDTITSKTMVDDIKDEEEKELLSELLATTIDIKLENELSQTQINKIAEEKVNDEYDNTDSFYSKSLELSKNDLLEESETHEEETDDNIVDYEEAKSKPLKIIFLVLVLLIVVLVVAYFVLQALGIKFN